MYHGDEQYKYLTNEGDLNNANDDSIALTPKTPKKVSQNSFFILNLLKMSINNWNVISIAFIPKLYLWMKYM